MSRHWNQMATDLFVAPLGIEYCELEWDFVVGDTIIGDGPVGGMMVLSGAVVG